MLQLLALTLEWGTLMHQQLVALASGEQVLRFLVVDAAEDGARVTRDLTQLAAGLRVEHNCTLAHHNHHFAVVAEHDSGHGAC